MGYLAFPIVGASGVPRRQQVATETQGSNEGVTSKIIASGRGYIVALPGNIFD
jgi:hypothetical protein